MSGLSLTRREMALAAVTVTGLGAISGAAVWRRRREEMLSAFNPELRGFVRQYLDHPPPDLSAINLATIRRIEIAAAPPPLPSPAVTRVEVAGLDDAPPIGIHVVNARSRGAQSAIFYLHGGGFVMGNSAGAVRQLQILCATLDCVGIAVDYRLAPETDHSGMLNDCNTALRWVHDHAATIGVDPARIAIMGASAGGGLAALLAMRVRDEGVVKPSFQLLVYPMLDDRTGSAATSSLPSFPSLWSAANNRFGWTSFLGLQPSANAVPARRGDLAELPSTHIAVGSLDLFLDENVRFAGRLADAGVPTELRVFPGAFHGFDLAVPRSDIARRFRAEIKDALASAFETSAKIRY